MESISTFLLRLGVLINAFRKINIVNNLAEELGRYIRPEYIKEPGESGNPHAINLDAIIKGMNINTELDREEVLEELVDDFKRKKYAEQVLVEMEALAKKKFGKESVRLVGFGAPGSKPEALTKDEKAQVQEMVKDLGPFGARYIKTHLDYEYQHYLRTHTTTEYLDKKHEDIEREDEESPGTHRNDAKFLHGEILKFLKKEHPGQDHLWARIFEEAFDIDGRSDKSFEQLAKDFNMPKTTFFDYVFTPMMKAIKEFLKDQGYHGEKREVEKEIEDDINDDLKKAPPKGELPDYQTYLKEPQNSKEFKEYLHKTKPARMSPRVVKILELFGEGLNNREVLTKMPEDNLEDIAIVKLRAFKKYYKNWYEEKMEKLKEETEEKTADFFMPYMVVGAEKPASIYKRMAETGRMGVLIEFTSDYTKQDMPKPDENGKIPDPHFAFESFTYTLNNFKKQHSLEYRYTQKAKDKAGNLEKGDAGESLLKLDGKPSNDHEVKEEIDARVEKLKLEGAYPHIPGLSVTYKNTNKKYSGKEYKGVQSFDLAFADLAPDDEPHRDRVKKFDELQMKKKIGPTIGESSTLDARRKIKELEDEIDSLESLLPIKPLKDIQTQLEREEARPAEGQDKERIKELKKQEQSYKELIQDKKILKQVDDLREMVDMLKKFITHKTIKPDVLEEYKDIKEKTHEFLESDFIKDELKEIRDDLKEEEEKSVEDQDKDYIKQLKKEEMGLLSVLRNQENLSRMEKEADVYGDLSKYLPPPGPKVKELVKIFEDYKLKATELERWTEPKDIKVLAKVLKNQVENTLQTELKGNAKKEDSVKNEIIKKHGDVLSKKTIDLFEEVPKDLKRRRDALKDKDPERYLSLSKHRNMDWVDSESEINSLMSYIKDALLTKEKGINVKDKIPGLTPINKADYKDLANHLHLELQGLHTIAQRFSELPLTFPKKEETDEKGKKVLGEVEKELNATEDRYKKIKNLITVIAKGVETQEKEIKSSLEKTPHMYKLYPELKEEAEEKIHRLEEHADELSSTFAELPELNTDIKKMHALLAFRKVIPAKVTAEVLQYKLKYFSDLYSKLSRCIWTHYKSLLRKGAEEPEIDVTGTLESHRQEAVAIIDHLAGLPITDNRGIKKGVLLARGQLKKFLELYPESAVKASIPYSRVYGSDEIITAEEDYGKTRLKAIIPEKDMHDAHELIKKYKNSEKTQLNKLAPGMQEELDKIMDILAEAYNKKYFSLDRVKEYAEKEKIPFQQAAVRLKKLQDVAAVSAIHAFILKWEDYLDARNKPKTRSDLGNKPGKKYRLMGKYIEKAIPELATLTPPDDDIPEEPAKGIPTPKEIRELIEKQFSAKEPNIVERTKEEVSDLFFGGGESKGKGGGKSKHRRKPVKVAPPNIIKEESKDQFVRLLEKETPLKIVTDHFLLPYAVSVRKSLKEAEEGLKSDEYLDIDSVIDGFVDHLKKQWNHMILSLRIDSPILNPKGSAPDIRITKDPKTDPKGALKEVQDWRKTFEGVRDQINIFIHPDTIGVPPKNLTLKDKRYFPSRLLELENEIQNIIDGKSYQSPYHVPKDEKSPDHLLVDKDKKIVEHPTGPGYSGYTASEKFPMSLRIMTKFAGTGIQDVEYSDKDVIR